MANGGTPPVRAHILLLGRFFYGRQSKGHSTAIDLFESILPSLPNGTELRMVGSLMTGAIHQKYLAGLRKVR